MKEVLEAGMTLSGLLHQPCLDLGPIPDGAPTHTIALEVDRRSLVEERHCPAFSQTIRPSFRDELILDFGLAAYDVENPLELARELRTPHWQVLCEHLENFSRLRLEVQVRVVRLLNRLGFFRYVRSLVPADVDARMGKNELYAGLAQLRAMAGYRLWSEDLEPSYHPDEFQRVALSAPPGLWKIAALYLVVRHHVKERADLAGWNTGRHFTRRPPRRFTTTWTSRIT